MPTLAERLNALTKKFAGSTHTVLREATEDLPASGHANYEIRTVKDGRVIVLTSPDGDAISGRGKTVEEAIIALEEKLQ